MSSIQSGPAGAQPASQSCAPPDLGDLIVSYLEELHIDYVFGVPGGAIEPFYNALARSARRGGIRPVVARHESGAAFMADGYARETGKLGVCCATTGPGATNLITGVASAFMDSVPLLVITAQTSLPQFGKRALQDSSCTAVDTVGMFRHCTRYNTLISHRGQLEGKLVAAIMAAHRGSGPAHVSIPSDILREPRRIRNGADRPVADCDTLRQKFSLIDPTAVEKLRQALEKANKVVVVIGGACGEAMEEILAFAENTGALLISGPEGKGWIDPWHPQYRGVYGFAGHESARQALFDEEVDLVLAVNTRLGEMMLCGGEEKRLLNDRLIHIDGVAEHFTRSPMARMHVCGAPRAVFESLNRSLGRGRPKAVEAPRPESTPPRPALPPQLVVDNETTCRDENAPLKPQRVMVELSTRFPENSRYLVDAGNSWAWATHYLHPKSAGRYRIAMGFGAMTWAIGAAVGTALGSPGNPVVCLTGDGSFLMSGQELSVAVTEKLPIIFTILNDRALGMVKHGQRLGGGEAIAFELPPVDFCRIARAMGARAYRIQSVADFARLDVAEICAAPGPTLLEIHIDPEETPPMGARMKTLAGKTPGVVPLWPKD